MRNREDFRSVENFLGGKRGRAVASQTRPVRRKIRGSDISSDSRGSTSVYKRETISLVHTVPGIKVGVSYY